MRVLGLGGFLLLVVRSRGRPRVVSRPRTAPASSRVSLLLLEGARSWIEPGLLAIRVAERFEFALSPVRQLVGKIGFLILHLLLLGVVVVRGRGSVQVGLVS